jgi:Sulfatase
MAIKKGLQIALFLLPAFYILHNYNQLTGFIEFRQVIKVAIQFYVPLLVCYFAILRLGISSQKTSSILLFISFIVLFFGPLQKLISHIPLINFLGNFLVFTLLCIVIIIVFIRKVLTRKELSPSITGPIGIIVMVLFVTEIGAYISNISALKKTKNLIYPEKPLSNHYISNDKPDSAKPDIYFFVFDAYTNNATLKTVWNFDNSEITDWLVGNGFHISQNTHSNYNFTVFSVSSTFNMNFIDPDKGSDQTDVRNILQANKSLSDNETFSILQKENYKIHFLAPFSNIIEDNGLNNFFSFLSEGQITRQTFPGCLHSSELFLAVKNKLHFKSNEVEYYYRPFKDKYEDIRNAVEKIKHTTDSLVNRRPHFVYGHFMVPHRPWLFDSQEKFISPEELQTATDYNTYVNQVKFANKLIRELVGYIKNHNKPNTVIILEGDHGFQYYRTDSIPLFAFKNFNAVYFPDKNYDYLYDTMSPINLFRIIFDKYFGQHYALLKDTSTIVKE